MLQNYFFKLPISERVILIKNILKEYNFNTADFIVCTWQNNTIYKDLCELINVKNVRNNRLRLYYIINKIHQNDISVQKIKDDNNWEKPLSPPLEQINISNSVKKINLSPSPIQEYKNSISLEISNGFEPINTFSSSPSAIFNDEDLQFPAASKHSLFENEIPTTNNFFNDIYDNIQTNDFESITEEKKCNIFQSPVKTVDTFESPERWQIKKYFTHDKNRTDFSSISDLPIEAQNSSSSTCNVTTTDDSGISQSTTILIPKGTKNLRIKKSIFKNGFANCVVKEGVFNLSLTECNMCFNTSNKTNINYLLKQKIKNANNTCNIAIKSKRFNKNTLIIYAECIHKHCKRFKIILLKSGKAELFSTNINYNHNKKMTSQVRGPERKVAKAALKFIKPLKFRMEAVKKSKSRLLQVGDCQDIKSDCTLRKIRSEALGSKDRDKDDFIDMHLMKIENPRYIQFISNPFQIHLYSQEQIHLILAETTTQRKPILHFDATGTVIKIPSFSDSSCLYYAGVISLSSSGRVCPIFELLSSQHDSSSIGVFLIKYKSYIIGSKITWPPFERVVTDFSFALINSICYFWNNMKLQNYLEIIFTFITENKPLPKDFIPINICCCHFTHIIAKDINSLNVSNKECIKEIMTFPFNTNEYAKIKAWFKNVVKVFSSKYVTKKQKDAYDTLLKICTNLNNTQENWKNSESEKVNWDVVKYKNSPFFKDFNKIFLHEDVHVETEDVSTLHKNDLYCPEIVKLALTKYLPYLPLWSGLLSKTGNRFSNAPVEEWNKELKHSILNKNKYVKPSRLVRECRKRIIDLHKEIKHGIFKTNLNRKNYDSDLLVTESWKDHHNKKKRRFAYHQMKNIKKSQQKATNKENNHTEISLLEQKKSNVSVNDINTENVKSNTIKVPFNNQNDTETICSWSVISEQNRSQYNAPLLQCYLNGLITDSEYYTPILNYSSYPVCFYPSLEISIEEFISLKGKPLNTAIDGCLNILNLKYNKNKDVHILPTGDLGSMTNDIIDYSKNGKSIFYKIFYILDNYKLLKIDKDSKKVKLYNGSIEQAEIILNTVEIDKSLYSIEVEKVLQKSPLYFIYIFESEFNKVHFDSIEDFLQHIYFELLSGSLSVEKTCLFCGFASHYLVIMRWVQCEGCFRWIHLNCIKSANVLELHKRDISYKCPLCTNYFLKKNSKVQILNPKSTKNIESIKYVTTNQIKAKFNFKHCFINELQLTDLKTLDVYQNKKESWLTNFLIDIAIGVLVDNNDKYTLINSTVSAIILRNQQKTLEDSEIYESADLALIPVLKNILIMPLLVNENHWCLVIADMNLKKFTYLDPFGKEHLTQGRWLAGFLTTLQKYKFSHSIKDPLTDNWRIQQIDHNLQTDDYNCGIYILMFIDNFVNNRPLTQCPHPNKYRSYLKEILLAKGRF